MELAPHILVKLKEPTEQVAREEQELRRLESELERNAKVRQNAEQEHQTLLNKAEQAVKEADEFRRKAEEEAKQLTKEKDVQRSDNSECTSVFEKTTSLSHRPVFEQGINAVHTTAEIAELMDTALRRMSSAEKQRILSYIRSASRVFRQTLRRKSQTPRKRQIDIRATIREAVKTDGEPVCVKYRQPRKSHAKVIILTDISGSCRNASELALYFMAEMGEAFPGGCRKYAFVNHLVSADQYFRGRSADEGVYALTHAIKTRGVYSDYGATIRELRAECGGSVHSDTTIIVIGDARNNRNASAADDLKYLADRCHKLFWLNTDDIEEWDQGDSVIGQYRAAGADVRHVSTSGELLEFLSSLPVRA